MPLEKIVLLVVLVMVAAAVTVWLGALVYATVEIPLAGLAFVPAMLVGYVIWRVVADRLKNAEDDRYDQIGK